MDVIDQKGQILTFNLFLIYESSTQSTFIKAAFLVSNLSSLFRKNIYFKPKIE